MEWLLLIVAIFAIFLIVFFLYQRNLEEYDEFVLQNGGLLFLTYDEYKLYWDHNVALKSKSANYKRVYCVYRVDFKVADTGVNHSRYVRASKTFNELSVTKKFLFIKIAYEVEFDTKIIVHDIDFDSFV
jgi:hypothetical protein